MTGQDAESILTSRSTFETEVTLNGEQTVAIEVREPKLDELDAIDAELPDGAQEVDYARAFIDEFLAAPDVAGSQMGMTKALAVFSAMQQAIQHSEAIENARAEMDLVEGNQ